MACKINRVSTCGSVFVFLTIITNEIKIDITATTIDA
jgi:hypothetical protein